jgi:3-oxoacyl-[acyl-carrier protein] reductase
MVKVGSGRIINIGSVFGEAAPLPGVTRGLSRELGATGVTVNGVQPGPIDTELSPADGPYSEALKRLTSVGRFGTVEEIASAVAFIAHPDSSFINGENLSIDGGWNA